MNRIVLILALVVINTFSIPTALAATDDFLVRQGIGTDIIPPSIPANLTATPVAISQIDLSWSSSTDNVAVSGYQVFRDGSQIATTGLISYSDVGLLENTLYSYYVTAYDSSDNVSASSTEVSTTTLSSTTTPPAPSPSTGASFGSKIVRIELESLEIISGTTSALLRFETKGVVRPSVRWGRTTDFEIGSLQKRAFAKFHEVEIKNLSPGTVYWFTIEGETHAGRFGILTVDSFTTLTGVDSRAPANVSNLRGYRVGNDIVLEWDNPSDLDFEKVRIQRNDSFYPRDVADGWFVYEGSGESARDIGAARLGAIQYYSVFAYDRDGNVSSGAVFAVSIGRDVPSTPHGVPQVPPVSGSADRESAGEEEDENAGRDDQEASLQLSFRDLVFVQDEKILLNDGRKVEVDGTKPFDVLLPANLLPQHLKTIVLDISAFEGDELGSFLLRIDEANEYYSATIASFSIEGRFPMELSIYDFETSEIAYVEGEIRSRIAYIPTEREESGFMKYLLSLTDLSLGSVATYSMLFILFLLFLFLLSRRVLRREEA